MRGIVLVLVLAAVVMAAAPAWAHEERVVGKYKVAVGFGSEPAYSGLENSVQLLVSDARTDKPVTDIGNDLKVEVVYGHSSMTLPIEPDFEVGEFGTPGDYRAWFFPTEPGRYTFRFVGSINKQSFNQSFTSGPKTFSDVDDPSTVQFPVKVPPANELAQRIDNGARQAASSASSARSDASTARTLGLSGLIVAIVALVLGALSLFRSRRS